MTGDRGDSVRPSDDSAPGNARSTTRRHVLAAVAVTGAGLGTGGVLRGGHDGDPASTSEPPSRPRGTQAGTEKTGGATNEWDADRTIPPAELPVLGANLNGRPYRLLDTLELIEASDTSWVRAFLDVRRKLENGGRPADDPDVRALRLAAREHDCRLIVSLKWDFKANWGDKEPITVPPSGSSFERALCDCAVEYLQAIGEPVDVVVLGNEPMWETLESDIRVDDSPIVRFTRTVKDYLITHGDHGDPTYLVGAFNRTHNDATRTRQFPHFYREMFDLVRTDEDVDGIDLHIHYGAFREAERTVAVARKALPTATITATEFSPVWRYARNVDTSIAAFEGGARFVRDHDLPAGTTAVEYFEHAKRHPLSPEALGEFYEVMPWYNVNHVEDMYALFAEYDVRIGTFGFLQGIDMRREDWTRRWTPFHINFLFQPALLRTDDGMEATAHPHYIDDYRRRTSR